MILPLLFALGGAIFTNVIGLGAAIGWGIGALIGQLLTPGQKLVGPRLQDLSVPTADYGTQIPRGIGRFPVAGIYVWSPGLIEITNKGNDGGFFKAPKPTTFTYFLSAHIVLAEGPITGVRRVWADGKLIADFTSSPDPDLSKPTADWLAFTTLYLGTLDQAPDRKTQDDIKIGFRTAGISNPEDVQSYPNVAYYALNKFPLKLYGNRIPRFKFEVISAGTSVPTTWADVTPSPKPASWIARSDHGMVVFQDSLVMIAGFNDTTNLSDAWRTKDGLRWERIPPLPVDDIFNFTPIVFANDAMLTSPNTSELVGEHILILGAQRGSNTYIEFKDGSTNGWKIGFGWDGSNNAWFDIVVTIPTGATGGSAMPRDSYGMTVWNPAEGGGLGLGPTIFVSGGKSNFTHRNATKHALLFDNFSVALGALKDMWFSGNFGLTWTLVTNGNWSVGDPTDNYNIGLGQRWGHTMLVFKGDMYVIGGKDETGNHHAACLKFNPSTNMFSSTITTPASGYLTDVTNPGGGDSSDVFGAVVLNDVMLAFIDVAGTTKIAQTTDGITWTELVLAGAPTLDTSGSNFAKYIEYKGLLYVTGGDEGGGTFSDKVIRTDLPVVTASTITLQTAFDYVINQTDLVNTPTYYDTSALSGTNITGLVISQVESGWDSLLHMMRTFAVDATESEGVLVFTIRGTHSGETIQQNDLAVFPEGDSPPDYAAILTKQDFELPLIVSVSYLDEDFDMEVNTQRSQVISQKESGDKIRQINEHIEVSIPIVMSAQQASNVAHFLLWSAWLERGTIPISTTLKHIKYDPGDVVDLALDIGTITVRFQERNLVQKNLILSTAVIEDVTLYTVPSGTGEPAGGLPNATPDLAISDTIGHVLDIPLLGMQDLDSYGPWYVMAPDDDDNTRWRADLWMNIDVESDSFFDYVAIGSTLIPNVIGTVTNITNLSSTVYGNLWDDVSDVTITLTTGLTEETGTLHSVSKSLALTNKLSLVLLGNEIMMFTSISRIDGTQVKFSGGLLRGLYGTEGEIGNHSLNERFVWLKDLNRVLSFRKSDLGRSTDFKFVTFNSHPDFVDPTNATITGIAKRPLSPVQLRGTRETSGRWLIDWIPRTRFDGDWVNGLDVPMSEPHSYIVEFYDSGFSTVLETRTINGKPALILSAEEQTSSSILNPFSSSLQNTLYLKVYHVSAEYPTNGGKSVALQGTLTL